jgi:hypothetical protein
MSSPEELLRGLAAADSACLDAVLSAPVTRPSPGDPDTALSGVPVLDGDARALVRLAALLAVEAPTASVCWAAELASAAGVDDEGLVAVLVAVRSCAQVAEVERNASCLAAVFDDADLVGEYAVSDRRRVHVPYHPQGVMPRHPARQTIRP